MKWWMRLCAVWAIGAAIAAPSGAAADNYPDRPVRIISDSAPGSAPDAVLRIVAERLGQAWGQQIVVMNQPGAGGSLAARAASAAPADGYTLFFAVASAFVTVKGNAPNIPIEVPRDFRRLDEDRGADDRPGDHRGGVEPCQRAGKLGHG